ncbi:MtrAB system histidine kinase MtrB [Actinoallomurus spadix]|uniref:Sensor histidine kinase MtrB n=1 Tax=Actinoallomurus spadix TaxID=79912 RepID=A0ABP3G7Z0_9ACTN|nr:MtrAB system histidine kinase MtrB [Actinoallomurus spadix]MCO5990875.1 MtrAB system histidine kinase MtrB [Actinoallomurus spadix]
MNRWPTLPSAARRGLHLIRRYAGAAVRRAYVSWRRSLQARVVTSTLLVSGLVVAVLGMFLMQQITTALLEAKERAALLQLDEGVGVAQGRLATAGTDNPDSTKSTLNGIVTALAHRSGPSGLYEVIIIDRDDPGSVGFSSNWVRLKSVPAVLMRQVEASNASKPYRTYGTLTYDDGSSKPGLIVGKKVSRYQLYYLFPLTQERQSLGVVQQTILGVGAALVLLLAAIASIVTRQVVIPVRMAAQAAERLAAGRLEERMRVRGEDDLARLATSFNDMAANLQEKIVQLQELSQVQRQFVSDVSHELRTPITTVRMAAEVLYEARADFDPMAARSAELLQSQIERFEGLLADLLEISRYDAGAATLDIEPMDVRELVLRAVGYTEDLAERKGSKIIQQLPGEATMAEVDRRRVERILRNLLVNAIEHGEGKDIVVSVAADRDAVAIAVRDHGCGLRPGEANMVFDRFWRADPARARTTGGTGLGLSISMEDAQLHGGWLQAWGEPGQGSQFRLSLPRVAGAELRGSPLPLVPPEIELQRAPYAELPLEADA